MVTCLVFRLGQQPMAAHYVAMIQSIHHDGIIPQIALIEDVQNHRHEDIH
jgi:hypothetical protein